jgi:hypothetical protein
MAKPKEKQSQSASVDTPAATPASTPLPISEPTVRDLSNINELLELIRDGKDVEITDAISTHLNELAIKHKLGQYNVLYLFDSETSINSFHSNAIYEAASGGNKKRDVLLIVQSRGGSIEPAYLISKTCKRLSKEKFVVSVPRKAKSAATLLALGADEIHMGLLSELGPIDPQINGYPALGLSNALNKVAELSAKFPKSADMWSMYLGTKLNLNDIGYFDRVSESAAQYAERLMQSKTLPEGKTPASLASHFVNHYKDHGFVIDYDESVSLLGQNIVKTSSVEYEFGNAVYNFLNLFGILLSVFRKKDFSVVGSSSGLNMREQDTKQVG